MNIITDSIVALGLDHPGSFTALFLASSFLMVWRLEAMGEHGLEGTALGTLVTPYCSGFGNLLFVYLVLRDKSDGQQVLINCLVNNVTNLTLVLGMPAVFWSLELFTPAKGAKTGTGSRSKAAGKAHTEQRLSRLSLVLTLLAVGFFTGAVWALSQDGTLDYGDGLVLVGLFMFWQCFQLFDVLKRNIGQKRTFSAWFYLDLCALLFSAWVQFESLDWLVHWITTQKTGFVSSANLGWLSGWLMVLPNAVLAIYYGAKKRADIVYASQIGDAHICIPLCIGLYALVKPLGITRFFQTSLWLLGGALAVHFILVITLGRLPKPAGWGLIAAYSYFLYAGFMG